MLPFIYVILSLVILFFTQKKLISVFGRLIHRFGGSRNSLIIFWSIIFLPGTVIHELSHFFFAILTGARTGKIEIFPRILEEDFENEEEGGVTLGFVQTQKLNPLQGVFVGLAPFIVGLGLLVWISTSIQSSYLSSSYYLLFFQGYLFFTISNSFFPSGSDLKHVIPVTVFITVLALMLWYLGIQFLITPSPEFFISLNTISFTLAISFILNLFIILLISILNKTLSKSR